MALLHVHRLSTEVGSGPAPVRAVQDVSFSIEAGQTLGLVGESGCGKTMTARSIASLLPADARVTGGEIIFDGQNLLALPEAGMRDIRGHRIGFVFQDPSTSLNPVYTIGMQVAEPLRQHLGLSRRNARERATELLARVGIPSPRLRLDDYPHQLSGGMRQRVMIAIALSCTPRLLIADEPTTALDVTIQAQILELIQELSSETGTAVLLITHNLGIAAGICDRIAVMYAGQIVETGAVDNLFYTPKMPYSWGLLDALPTLSDDERLVPIEGGPPDLGTAIEGCHFAPRCRHVRPVCRQSEPALSRRGTGHDARCHATEPEGWLR
ncbi:ABC transporter ATP-binding protein [Dactylosporangium salmoneum]|uniref:ABC transporter ATP-binding protein n=1 Tax=Dactylosporangium salmoneum TaxID=53361 RepID=A0ABP5UZE8_9ACTN